jgi:hypothetical protein
LKMVLGDCSKSGFSSSGVSWEEVGPILSESAS